MRSATVSGKAILAAREDRGLSQAALADLIGCDQTTISYWELGKRSPTPALFKALLTALDVSRDDLLAPADGEAA